MDSIRSKQLAVTSGMLQTSSVWRRMAEKALAEDGISVARANTLLWIGRLGGGVRQVKLAETLGLTSNSLVRLLDELSASGLVERRDDPLDRRAKSLWLTKEGRLLADRVEDVLSRLRERVLRDISDTDLDAALRVFSAILAAEG
ncbi:MarR family transcriptional regulator [Sinorhizobium sp. BG8]|uniref:MarR family winged helix-turn-helix transcriptional regulator n=1 Tax=Sinorhizobium sp. BG8 TaxID=2613773 RepID=UPI00193EBFF7|nr:MarR family transcriptional regulator [Sinorhizobium sp. BG8]QRM53205.1 MarR family transcriptional regulator [Sinorhizobium sp. BG8]